jgi:CubicO group peptidase (beta-lactamase class C family)
MDKLLYQGHEKHYLMNLSANIDDFAHRIKDLPDQTQISVATIHSGIPHYFGLIKDNGAVKQIDNATSAFETGSVTKAFTGNVLAQLVMEEKVRLDDLIQQYLPFSLLNTPPITLAHLALHTSGLQRMPHDFHLQPNFDKNNPFKNYTEQQLATYFSEDLRLDGLPGEKYQYSNLGAGLLSYIISRVEGKPFAKIVAERIFTPLKMNNSTFDVGEIQTEMVRGIDENGNFCEHWYGGIMAGCLGIISTAEDLARFAIISTDVSDPACSLQAGQTFIIEPNVKSNLGWQERVTIPENVRMQGINGGTGGCGASILLNRERNCSVVALTNISPGRYLDLIYPLNRELLLQLSLDNAR